MTTRRVLCLTLWVGGLLGLGGCASTLANQRMEPSRAPTPRANLAFSDNQIRLRMRALVDPMSGEIERAADQIIAGTTDPAVKRAAIELKIDAVPALREALFEPDPINAAIDTWVLLKQLAGYFETGPGRTTFGGSASIALETVRRMDKEFAATTSAMTVKGDVSQVEADVGQWAAEHPIRYAIRDRETSLGLAAARNLGTSFSAGEVIADFSATADDLSRRLEAAQRPAVPAGAVGGPAGRHGPDIHSRRRRRAAARRARHRVDRADRRRRGAAVGGAGTNRSGHGRAPGLVAAEREAALNAAHVELGRTLSFLQEERITALQAVSDERIAALQHLSAERATVIKELQAIVAAEHAAITREAETVAVQIVDHLMWRVAQLVAAVLAALTVAAVVLAIAVGGCARARGVVIRRPRPQTAPMQWRAAATAARHRWAARDPAVRDRRRHRRWISAAACELDIVREAGSLDAASAVEQIMRKSLALALAVTTALLAGASGMAQAPNAAPSPGAARHSPRGALLDGGDDRRRHARHGRHGRRRQAVDRVR